MAFDLVSFADSCGVAEPEHFVRRCAILRELLVEANTRVNLTRITEEEDFALKHVADSLLIARFFPELRSGELTVADLGCGAGFPTLILALAFPRLRLCAIDSTAKKLKFVAAAAAALELPQIRTVHGRIDELGRQSAFQGAFDFVTARAVGDAVELARAARSFPRRGGWFAFYKTPGQAAEELPRLGAPWKCTPTYELPGCGGRLLVFLKKK